MNDIIKSFNDFVSRLNQQGILTVHNAVIAYIVGLVMLIIPVKSIRALGGLVIAAISIGWLLIWLCKVAELTA